MNALEALGFDETYREEFDRVVADAGYTGVVPGRVSADFGMQLEVLSPVGRRRGQLVGRFLSAELDRPAVGDWVVFRETDEKTGQILDQLTRRTELVRQAAGETTDCQVIGANLDIVFVVASLNLEFNLKRIERYLTAVREGGATPVVVLNKADLVDERDSFVAQLRESAPDVDVVVTSATEQEGLDRLAAYLEPATTAAFVGSSGVGKSTLVNKLAKSELMLTKHIREDDAKGRHTTTHRQLLELPDGAVVIDTPGMREFQLFGAEEGLEEVFEDIEELASYCRFRDCEHRGEPGCEVRAALEDGELSATRLAQYHKLQRELAEHRDRTEQANWR